MKTKSKRARYKEWLDHGYTGPRNAIDEAALLKVADAYDAVRRGGKLTPKRLQAIVDGASNKKMIVWANSSDLLELLSYDYRDAAVAILEMSKSRHGHVRFSALCSLGRKTPPDIVDAVIRSGLIDKSSRVRWKAADKAHSLTRKNLVPDIMSALKHERNAKTRSTIEFEFKLLRDGYILEKKADGRNHLVVSYDGGITNRSVDAKEMKAQGIDSIVNKMRKEREESRRRVAAIAASLP
jgi:hypothetical protein